MDKDKLVTLAIQADAAWGARFFNDEPVAGSDLVQWFGSWIKEVGEARRAITTPCEIIDSLLDAAEMGAGQLTEYSEEDGPIYEDGEANFGDTKADYEERAVTAWQAITAARNYLKSEESK
jgi:hypothetical protein